MKKRFIGIAAVLAAGMLAGCGGGSSTTDTAKVAGKVADGYLQNATVFMDINGNYRLDAGEPSAQTDANGAYALTVDPADVGKYPIVALAVKDVTIDMDSPNEKIAYSYLLSLPKESVSGTVSSNFISPLTTQVREMLETHNYTMEEAMTQLRERLHLDGTANVMGDYIAGQNQTMHTTAQNMSTIMGGQMGQVFTTSGTTPTVDVNRYRGMMGAMFSNMSSVRAANTEADMTGLMSQMTSTLGTMSITQPFHNMSSYYRQGMMWGGGMMQ